MQHEPIPDVMISDAMIRLGQFLKLSGLAQDGSEAKDLLDAEEVTVNGEIDTRRGAQLKNGDVIAVGDQRVRLVAAES